MFQTISVRNHGALRVSSEETFYPYSLLGSSSSNFGFMHIKSPFNIAGFSDGQQQWMEVGGCVAPVKLLGTLSRGVRCGSGWRRELLSHANRHKVSVHAGHVKNICGCHSHAATSACCTPTAAAAPSWPPDFFFFVSVL